MNARPGRRVALDELRACPACDLLHHRRALDVGERSRCTRCGTVLETRKAHTVERTLAAVLAGIVLLLLSLTLPFLGLSQAGIESRMSVLDAVGALWTSDLRWLGLLTLALIVLLPLARLTLLGWVLARLRLARAGSPALRAAFRWALRLEPWAMADVFMVGVAVSLVKIASMAHLQIGLAFWALGALVAVTVLIELTLCKDTIWRHLNA